MTRYARAVIALGTTLPSLLLAICLGCPHGALFAVPFALAGYAVFTYLRLPAGERRRRRPVVQR
ncbi:hypothetical protein ACIHFE_16615 [Streptomyces sp. NPDC052396]|uniref:hypothetical protein n=1 Tax=Streptomyces sp. NPDC052396 TaxID=3365689 RepID=UPI0037CF1832